MVSLYRISEESVHVRTIRDQTTEHDPTLRVDRQRTANERFLELRAHELVSAARVREHPEVNPEEEHVHASRYEYQCESSRKEVLCDMFLPGTLARYSGNYVKRSHHAMSTADVQDIP
jgi:hypothetical protein